MSIKKIIQIKNIGRFVHCRDILFDPVTLIYAENGSGKSTLSAIVRSLANQSSHIIQERLTIGSIEQCSVQLIFDENEFVEYKNQVWQKKWDYIEVFDETFIAENIYSGQIESHHRTQLYEFAIGSLAVEQRKAEKDLDDKIADIDGQLRAYRTRIKKSLTDDIQFEDFIRLEEPIDLENQINRNHRELEILVDIDAIHRQEQLQEVPVPIIPFDSWKAIIHQTIEDIESNAETQVKQHITVHFQSNASAEKWIQDGVKQISDDICPFCGQSLSSIDLIKAYQSYFNQAYRELKAKIADILKIAEKILAYKTLLDMQAKHSFNHQQDGFCKKHLQQNIEVLDFASLQQNWQLISDSVLEAINQKNSSPLDTISLETWDIAIDLFEEIRIRLEDYNGAINLINHQIEDMKKNSDISKLKEKQLEALLLQKIQRRHTEPLKSDCDSYLSLSIQKDALSVKLQEAKQKLDSANKTILEKYQTSINDYLQKFGVDFSITKNVDRRSQGSPRLMLSIVVNSTSIDISSDGKEGHPSFKNTLSTGDKTALALAFFFARLDQLSENRLNDTIVILDDPVTSLDQHRQHSTIVEIFHLTKKIKQMILLSHDAYFLRDTSKRLQRLGKDMAVLQIKSIPNSASDFIAWNIDESIKSRFHLCYERVSNFVRIGSNSSEELENAHNSIRVLMEGLLQRRFPSDLRESSPLGEYIGQIKNAALDSPLQVIRQNKSALELIEAINDYGSESHHDDPHHINRSNRQLMTYAKSLLKFMHGEI